jgi:hypothetical protein
MGAFIVVYEMTRVVHEIKRIMDVPKSFTEPTLEVVPKVIVCFFHTEN